MMIAVRHFPKPLLLLLVLLLGFALAVPLMGAKGGNGQGGKGGNSDVAKACDNDGWVTLATAEDPYTAFTSKDACVAYGAETGTAPVAVLDPVPTLAEACASLGGEVSYPGGSFEWKCISSPYSGPDFGGVVATILAGYSALADYCAPGLLVDAVNASDTSVFYGEWDCYRQP